MVLRQARDEVTSMPSDETLLEALQRGLPLESRPFACLADELGCREPDIVDFIARCRERGIVRRFGGVFDTRRLGYASALCAARLAPDALEGAVAALVPLKGVTHCYLRELPGGWPIRDGAESFPNLWFTLSCPRDIFSAMADEVRSRLAGTEVHVLPALRRYKVDVVFGAATRVRDESVADDGTVSAVDRAVIRALQGDTEARGDYFAAIAASIGMTEWDLLSRLELWRRSGRLKRIGLLLAHRRAGWTSNGMCCWRVDGDTTEVGHALAACDEVTHCYERSTSPVFPYNVFAMVHARSPEEASAQYARLEAATGLSGGVMLVSTREYKKTSMTFFAD